MLPTKHTDHLPSKNAIVVRSNKLIEASYNLSLQQLRLIHWLSRAVQEDDEDYKYYEIDVPLFLQFLQLKGSNSARDRIREVTRKLQEKTILIKNPENDDEWEQFSWLRYSKVYRKDNRLVLRLSINPEMLPYIRDLRAAFTKTSFYQITAFNSRYGWRFYEWCKQFEGIGWLEITVAELRSRLQIGEAEYARFNNLRQRVINPALKEICTVSDLDVVLAKTIKKGRSVHALKFKICAKSVHVVPTTKDTEPSEESLIVERLASHSMPDNEARKNVLKFYKYDREHLLGCLADVENKVESGFAFQDNNPLIWLRYLLKNDQRPQSTLFVRSANRKLSPEEQKAVDIKRRAKERIVHLEGILENVSHQYAISRDKFLTTEIPKIDEPTRSRWRDAFMAKQPSNFQSLVRGDQLFKHKLYRRDVDAFLYENGVTPLTYDAYCQSVGVSETEIKTEIENLKTLLT